MMADIPERNIAMNKCVTESQLNEFITELHGSEQFYKGEEIEQQVISDADWIGHCRSYNSPLSNTVDHTAGVCWKCGANKQYLYFDWFQDPFHWHDSVLPISSYPDAVFPSIELYNARYCWMHNLTNVLSDIVTHVHDILPSHSNQRHSFHDLVNSACPSWYPTKPFIPHEMKSFFSHDISTQLVPLYQVHEKLHSLRWPYPPYSFVLTTSQVVKMLFDSITTFYNFAYTHLPSKSDFQCVRVARNCTLSIYHHFHWKQQPTLHYMLSHGILDAETDGTAYNTLQEGVEHINSQDKRANKHTFHLPNPSLHHPESSMQYILNQYKLRLYFIKHNYSQSPHQLTPASSFVPYTSHIVNIPKYAPI